MSVASVPTENMSFASEPNANLATASLLYSKVPLKHLTSVRHYKAAVKCCLSNYICNWPCLVPYHRQTRTKLLKHTVQLKILLNVKFIHALFSCVSIIERGIIFKFCESNSLISLSNTFGLVEDKLGCP